MPVKDKFYEMVLAERNRLAETMAAEEDVRRGYYPQAQVIQTRKDGHPSYLELAEGKTWPPDGLPMYWPTTGIRLQDLDDTETDLAVILAETSNAVLDGQVSVVKIYSDLLLLVAWLRQDGLL